MKGTAGPGEARRKLVHVGCGLIALALRFLAWQAALALALAALVFNALVLPRVGGKAMLREDESRRGWSAGILLYPGSIALLILIFRDRLEIVAGGWALLAFGDGLATVVGTRWGRHSLPWNARKSVEGVIAHALAGWIAAAALVAFVRPDAHEAWAIAVACGLAALVTSLLESLQSGVNDNLLVSLSGSATIWLLLAVFGAPLPTVEHGWRALVGLDACALLAAVAWWRGSLSTSGAFASVVVGTLVLSFGGIGAFAVLLAFFVLGTAATKLGRRVKEARGIGEARGGRRAFGNVLANGGLAACCALAMLVDGPVTLAAVALVASLATAAFDTVSSEFGKAFGRRTFLPTTLRSVSPGTEGAVSVEGTAAGFLAAMALAVVGVLGGVLPEPRWLAMGVVVLGGVAGSTFESYVGALSQARGHVVHNDVLNFANTAGGALAAVAAWELVR